MSDMLHGAAAEHRTPAPGVRWTSKRVQATLQAMAWQVRSVRDMLGRLQEEWQDTMDEQPALWGPRLDLESALPKVLAALGAATGELEAAAARTLLQVSTRSLPPSGEARLQADSATGMRSAAGGLALQVELIRDAVEDLAAATLRRALKLHRTDPALNAERTVWCELQVCGPFLDTALRALSTAAEVQVVRPPAPECAAQRRKDARRQRGRPP